MFIVYNAGRLKRVKQLKQFAIFRYCLLVSVGVLFKKMK